MPHESDRLLLAIFEFRQEVIDEFLVRAFEVPRAILGIGETGGARWSNAILLFLVLPTMHAASRSDPRMRRS